MSAPTNTSFAGVLPYERGAILASTEDELAKLRRAWREIARRRSSGEPVYNFTGLERSLRVEPDSLELMDDELAPAVLGERLRELALDHLGGDPARHDVLVCNRLTAAVVAASVVLVEPGATVVGISPSYSHPVLKRAAAYRGARFVETKTVAELERALTEEHDVGLVTLTRLAVTYDTLETDAILGAIAAANAAGVPVLVDDAGGARVGPAIFGQPRTLELRAEVGVTGLDKYGTTGPRLGLLGGEAALVAEIRARAFELGLEARPMLLPAVVETLGRYAPERVRELVACTREVTEALRGRLGDLVYETPVTAQLHAEEIHGAIGGPAVAPYEATAALAMLLLLDHGILTVHFAGIPPGTSALLFKFIPPELLEAFGGAERLAEAVAASLDRLATIAVDAVAVRRLLFEEG